MLKNGGVAFMAIQVLSLLVVLANTVLAWSNHNGPAQRVVGVVHGGKGRDQEEVVTVHTWTSIVMELALPSSSGS